MSGDFPQVAVDEITTLVRVLDARRRSALAALDGLDDQQAVRRPLPHTDLSVAGVVLHLARMEDLWLGRKLAGELDTEPWASRHEETDWDFRTQHGVAEVRAAYVAACERSRAILARTGDLSTLAAQPAWGSVHVSLRWILVHLIEETAQHLGHLDLLRDALLAPLGSATTRLTVIRGNSGAGKTTVARSLRSGLPRGALAWVGQDLLRRDILDSPDSPGNLSIDLIDRTVRLALDTGRDVVLEGILSSTRYADLLLGLAADHVGQTRCYYLDVPFEETVRRHATKPAQSFGAEEMRRWYEPLDLVEGLAETVVGPDSSAAATADLIRAGWG
ncbi:MAG: DUF664 domain-containing protein [Actinobacteria bacterium]|uniref:Unannotated protein n=1 Tax=freshwater metagenome TaxID=449393 RepID=A0A6J6NGA5_9ZZZZ|nr:DUF664 domain-containing protein [Actinomycetota bacterium]